VMNQGKGLLFRWACLRHVHPLWWRVGAFHRRLGNWSLKNVNDHGNPDEKDVVREDLHIL
jgi:hypothetical protein